MESVGVGEGDVHLDILVCIMKTVQSNNALRWQLDEIEMVKC